MNVLKVQSSNNSALLCFAEQNERAKHTFKPLHYNQQELQVHIILDHNCLLRETQQIDLHSFPVLEKEESHPQPNSLLSYFRASLHNSQLTKRIDMFSGLTVTSYFCIPGVAKIYLYIQYRADSQSWLAGLKMVEACCE